MCNTENKTFQETYNTLHQYFLSLNSVSNVKCYGHVIQMLKFYGTRYN